MFINNNARFCYQSKEKVLSSNTPGRIIDDDLEKSLSDECGSESDEESNQ